MLIPFPLAYLFGSAVVNFWARASGRPRWFRTADHLSRLGLGSAVVAALPGLIDYTFAVPPKSSARKRATSHMLANLSAVTLFAAARLGRRNGDDPPSSAALAAELGGAALLVGAGWMGGTLVYRNQIGVDHRYAGAGKWRVAVAPKADTGVDVGAADALEVGQMQLVRVGDERIVIGRTDRGYVAFDDRCPHRGGPLSDGALACDTVQCPWHGSQFDVHTGTVERGPAEEGIRTHPVTVRDGRLLLDASAITPAPTSA